MKYSRSHASDTHRSKQMHQGFGRSHQLSAGFRILELFLLKDWERESLESSPKGNKLCQGFLPTWFWGLPMPIMCSQHPALENEPETVISRVNMSYSFTV